MCVAAAFAQIHKNPKNTVFGVKSLLGKKFSDEGVQKAIKGFPFAVEEGEGGEPVICVELQEKPMRYSPSQVAAMILKDLKEFAQKFTGQKFKQVVLAVPASYDEAQRAAVMEAGKGAGLEVLRIISEPAAAAIAFGLDVVENNENGIFVVFDFGAVSLDVTVLEVENGLMTVLSTVTNSEIGGESVDTILVEHFAKEFQRKYKADMRDSKKVSDTTHHCSCPILRHVYLASCPVLRHVYLASCPSCLAFAHPLL
jgi:L1 cell adhesion molecule like protein